MFGVLNEGPTFGEVLRRRNPKSHSAFVHLRQRYLKYKEYKKNQRKIGFVRFLKGK